MNTANPDAVPLTKAHQALNLYKLPEKIGELTDAISRQFQIDSVIPFGQMMGCIAAAMQGKITTQITANWIEHSSFYVMTIAETGDGKSQTMSLLRKPIDTYEAQLQSDARFQYALRNAEHKIAENRLDAIQKSMANTRSKTPATQQDLIAALEKVKETKPDPIPLIALGGDVTPDSLTDLLALNGSLAILDAEGTLYSHLSGRKHGTGSAWETMLQAYTGDPIKVHRIGRDGGSATNPHLVINTSIQPKVWREVQGDENAAGRGAVGRFLVFNARSDVGYRDVNAAQNHPIDPDLISDYEKRILQILNIKDPRKLSLTPEQLEIFTAWRSDHEITLRDPDNRLDGFGTRLPGMTIRNAMIFSIFENPDAHELDTSCLQAALDLSAYLIEQRKQADEIKEKSPEQRILDFIRNRLYEYERRKKSGDIGDALEPFSLLFRDDLQQNIKQQAWVKDGGSEAIKEALQNLDKKNWIYLEGDRIYPRADLLQLRW
jgi:hypothetical protein